MKTPLFSRRNLLLAGAAGAGAASLGAIWFAAASPKDLIYALIERALPGVQLDPASVGECAGDVLADLDVGFQTAWMQRFVSHAKLRTVRMAGQAAGLDRVAGLGPFEQRLEEITRMAITRLLPNSNFFDLADPKAELVYYTRPDPNQACVNRFADLSLPG